MYKPTKEELCKLLNTPIFRKISETADALGMECYVVGGYVRDIFLERPSTDIDVVVVGKGIEMARAFSKRLGKGAHLSVFAKHRLNTGNMRLSLWVRVANRTATTRATPLWRTAHSKTTKTAGTLQ